MKTPPPTPGESCLIVLAVGVIVMLVICKSWGF